MDGQRFYLDLRPGWLHIWMRDHLLETQFGTIQDGLWDHDFRIECMQSAFSTPSKTTTFHRIGGVGEQRQAFRFAHPIVSTGIPPRHGGTRDLGRLQHSTEGGHRKEDPCQWL